MREAVSFTDILRPLEQLHNIISVVREEVCVLKTGLVAHFFYLLKCMYQAMEMICHVNVCYMYLFVTFFLDSGAVPKEYVCVCACIGWGWVCVCFLCHFLYPHPTLDIIFVLYL